MRILLVEDDPILGDGIVAGLKLGDYAVDWVRDGESARLALLDHPYDACVLDLGLPRRSGLSVLSDLRARGSRLPVLILTARDTSADKVAGPNCSPVCAPSSGARPATRSRHSNTPGSCSIRRPDR